MKSSAKTAAYGGVAIGIGLLVYFTFFRKHAHADAAAIAAPAGPDAGTSMALNQLSNQMSQIQQQQQLQQQNAALLASSPQQGTNPYAPNYNPALATLQPAITSGAPLSYNQPTTPAHSGFTWILGAGPTGPMWLQEPAPTPPGQHWAQTGDSFYLAANQPGISYPEIRPTAPSMITSATHA